MFEDCWQRQHSTFTQDNVDEDTLDQLSRFLADTPISTQRGRLRTALLLTGLDSANYDAVLRKVSTAFTGSGSSVLAGLQTQQCSNLQAALKNLIKGVIVDHSGVSGYNDFLAKHKRLLPLNFDLEILERYVSDHLISQIVVSLSDAETFDTHVTNELIHTLCSWQGRINFTLMLGITSTRELFEHRISKSCLKRIEARSFNFAPSKDLISDLLRGAQDFDGPLPQVFLGPSVTSVLSDIYQMQGKSAHNLQSTLHYLYSSHFFANPIALLADPEAIHVAGEERKLLAQVVRSTESFKVFCENILAEGNKASNAKLRQFLDDDEVLLREMKDRVQAGQKEYDASRRVLDGFADLCHELLRGNSKRPTSKLEIEAQLYHAAHDLTDTEAYEETVKLAQDLMPPALLQILNRLPAETISILDLSEVLKALQNEIRPEQILNGNLQDGTDALLAGANGETIASVTPATPKRRGKNVKTGTLLSEGPRANGVKHSSAKAAFLTTLEQKLQASSLDVMSFLLHEAYVLSARTTRFKPTFEPHPRASIERALLQPNDYLSWHQDKGNSDACSSDAEEGNESDTRQSIVMPPASILFTLLQEAPSIINVRDLFDAFRSRLEPQHETNGDVANEDEDADLKATMTQFYRTLAELKMMGLVKSSTGTQVKRATKGKSGKSGTQDIDFIAKTSWAGL